MKKRQFLTSAAIGATALPAFSFARNPVRRASGPALLTVSGAISNVNRGQLDPALDQMMHKQQLKFDKAHAFGFAEITALPAISITPTLEYDAKSHVLSGPLLVDVVSAAGGKMVDATQLLLRAVDGYAVAISLADVRKYRFIVATHLDGQPMPLGGLGPLWAVYDADRFSEMAAKPLNERFALCPWALYHVDVQSS